MRMKHPEVIARFLPRGVVRRRQDVSDAAADTGAERDVTMALCAALFGTLILAGDVGVESQWELFVLLAVVAGLAILLDRAALQGHPRAPRTGRGGK